MSFNSLTTLEGLRSLPRLKHLDVSWNELMCYRDAIGVMRRHMPAIQVLQIQHNPWNKVSEYVRSTASIGCCYSVEIFVAISSVD